MNNTAEFDRFADTYDADLNQALSVSGETKDYFARARVQWLANRLRESGEKPCSAMDYGCGIGDTTALLRESLGLHCILGLDVSLRSVEVAKRQHGASQCIFQTFDQHVLEGNVDLVYCNGVFHHIPVAERDAALRFIHDSLRPGGMFALWENNPWNPGTRLVMSRIPFDRDAVRLPPPEVRRLLLTAGFRLEQAIRFLFYFPRALSVFRALEPWLVLMPLGAQYYALGRRVD